MRIVVTGAEGFIAKNLRTHLRELKHEDVRCVIRDTSAAQLQDELASADFVFHLAGVNRPQTTAEFAQGNSDFTRRVCEVLAAAKRGAPVVYASSTQAVLDNPYGLSKRAAEEALMDYGRRSGAAVYVFRLTNVFGKWARPFYNSAVATFCHQAANGLALSVNDRAAPLRLVHVDDVVAAFVRLLSSHDQSPGFVDAGPEYETSVGDVADALRSFVESRGSLLSPPVGTGLMRALYSTYVSHLRPESFSYAVPKYGDPRGEFVEMLKTPDCGQFSYFTAHPGVTRGEHYHHTKTEKFLVIRGRAHFGFRNIDTDERFEIVTDGGEARIVETIPGWAHNITNVGADELVVMLWANEIFDRARPDTIAMKVAP